MIRTKKTLLIALAALASAPGVALGDREVIDFNREWRFTKGEQTDAAKQLSFDDSSWQTVRLPHDWAIAGPFQPEGDGNTGKLPWRGVGWYRKAFTPKGSAGQRVYFDFDGVMAFSKVYVNGQLAGTWNYGYTSFRIDATPYIRFGERNVYRGGGGYAAASVALVSGSGNLSKSHHDGDRPGAYRALGHVREYAGRQRCARYGAGADLGREAPCRCAKRGRPR